MTTQSETKLTASLFILRIALGAFMMVWAIEKFVLPETAQKIYKNYFHFEAGETMVLALGTALTVLAICVLIGAFKRYTYAAMLLIHSSTVIFTSNKIIDPYGLISGKPGHLFVAAVPVWAAMLALYMLRERDTYKSFDERNTAQVAPAE